MSRSSFLVVLALASACRVTNDDTSIEPNGGPTAIDMTVELPEDTPTDIRLEANEPDGDDLTFAITTAPEHGEAILNGRRVEYTPDPDYFGSDAFSFTASDDDGTSEATVSLTITPVNDPPRVTADDTLRLVGQHLTLDAEVSDPEGDEVTISWSQTSGPVVDVSGTEAPAFLVRAAGTYVFTASVSDGTDTDDVDITVRAMDVSLSPTSIAAIDAEGGLWSWGEASPEVLGHPAPIAGVVRPVCEQDGTGECTAPLGNMAAVSATEDYTLAIDRNGDLWGWGDRRYIFDTDVGYRSPARMEGLTDLVSVAASSGHAVVLDSQGRVWAWGNDASDALGNPDADDSDGPSDATQVCTAYDAGTGCTAFLTDVVSIATGRLGTSASLAVDASGTVWAWGENDHGILGDDCAAGECDDSGIARPVCSTVDPTAASCSDITGVMGIDVGRDHAIAVDDAGRVFAWGRADSGQLGNGCDLDTLGACPDTTRAQPVCEVGESGSSCAPLTSIVHIAAGDAHTLFVDDSGAVFSTGGNDNLELGDGCTDPDACVEVRSTVEPVCASPADDTDSCEPLTGVIGVRANEGNSAAVTASGEVIVWGDIGSGIAGNAPDGGPLAVRVGEDTDWSMISAGDDHAVALKTDGTLWGIGNNDDYGVGHCTDIATCPLTYSPVALTQSDGTPFPAAFQSVSAGAAHSAAVDTEGTLWMWGDTRDGALATDDGRDYIGTPEIVTGIGPVSDVSLGEDYSLALMADGTIQAWGAGSFGQLGNGDFEDSADPVMVLTGDMLVPDTDWVAIEAGTDHAIAQKADGTLWGWGANGDGQLGFGGTDDASTAVQTLGVEGSPSHTDWTAFSGGGGHTAAIRGGGLWLWGDLEDGRRGDGCLITDTCDLWAATGSPVPVPGPSGWVDVVAGDTHTVALHGNGSVWAFGEDDTGSLGIGVEEDVSVLTAVCLDYIGIDGTCDNPLTDVVFIDASDETGYAIREDGSLWAWGDNDDGRHGYGPPYTAVPIRTTWNAVPE